MPAVETIPTSKTDVDAKTVLSVQDGGRRLTNPQHPVDDASSTESDDSVYPGRYVLFKYPQEGEFECGLNYRTAIHTASVQVLCVVLESGKKRREILVTMDREAARTGIPHKYASATVFTKAIHQWVANLRYDPDRSIRMYEPGSSLAKSNLTAFLAFMNKNNPPYPIVDAASGALVINGTYLPPDYGDEGRLLALYRKFLPLAKLKIQQEKVVLDGPRPLRKSKTILQVEAEATAAPAPPRRLSYPAGKRDNVKVEETSDSAEAARTMSAPTFGQTSGSVSAPSLAQTSGPASATSVGPTSVPNRIRKINLIHNGIRSEILLNDVERIRPNSAPVVPTRPQRGGRRNKAGLEVNTATAAASAPGPSSARTAPVGGNMMHRVESSTSLHSRSSISSSLDVMLLTPSIGSSATLDSGDRFEQIEMEAPTEEAVIAVEGQTQTGRKRKAPAASQPKKKRRS